MMFATPLEMGSAKEKPKIKAEHKSKCDKN